MSVSPEPPSLPSTVAARLIAAGGRPLVLGVVAVRSGEELTEALFDALAQLSEGADGIDLLLPPTVGPIDRLAIADQLADTSGAALFLRSDAPMAAGSHTLILSGLGRVRPGANVIHDIGIDQLDAAADSPLVAAAWPEADDKRSTLMSTIGFAELSDAALMGLASGASTRGIAAVSTNRVRIVRRVVDTLAPLTPRPPSRGMAPCR